ncbi:hypothetical protein SERN_2672 [Serinibacter arcticus]|uniref:Uncharacterized protein n=1 Tax=Serinibacter arcticus TaxID=1655435 RepID=A0A4Z1E339_9MICO|nr:hypothetical protein SERN_2672 [Serinibacter arcticus]
MASPVGGGDCVGSCDGEEPELPSSPAVSVGVADGSSGDELWVGSAVGADDVGSAEVGVGLG